MTKGDYLADKSADERMRMSLQDPRTLHDTELLRRAYQSVGGERQADQIIGNARWEVSRREAEALQRRATEAVEKSARRLAFITWVLVGIGVFLLLGMAFFLLLFSRLIP